MTAAKLARWIAGLVGILAAFGHGAHAAQGKGFASAANGTQYFQFAIDEDALAGPPDRSALNRPLDGSARLFVRDGHFFSVGTDGRPGTADDVRTRLFGVNLSFGANFPNAQEAVQLARRLRKHGFNAVRLHHMDSLPSDYVDPPLSLLTSGPYPSFNPVAVTRLRDFIAALGQEGIYVNLNLHVGYRFRPAIDGLPALDNGAEKPIISAPLDVYHPRMIALQETYARQLIGALGLRDNPILAMVEINNESSLLSSWQHAEWQDAVPSAYAPLLEQQWQAWLVQQYGSTAAACAAWTTCANPKAPPSLPTPADADVPETELGRLIDRVERKIQTTSGKLFGTSPADSGPLTGHALRIRDFLRFLAHTDRAYFDRMRTLVRAETQVAVPVTGTQMAFGGVLNFDSHADMDYIDEHIYVGHPMFPGKTWDPLDWRIADVSATGGDMDRLLALSLRRDVRKPFVVSEFNQPFPNPRGAEILPLMALIGALQDWDGLFFFDYHDRGARADAPTQFSLTGEWGKLALAGQSAQLFRTGLLAPLPTSLALPLPAGARDAIAVARVPGSLEADIARRLNVVPAHAWQARLAQDLSPPAGFTVPAKPVAPFATPDGRVRYDPVRRQLLMQTEHAWGVFGDAVPVAVGQGGTSVSFPATAGAVSILLTALDDKPLAASQRMLLTLGNASTGTQPGSRPARPKELVRYRNDVGWLTLEPDPGANSPSGPRSTQGPAWVARSETRLTLATGGHMLTVYPLDGSGGRRAALPAAALRQLPGGSTEIHLQGELGQASLWYEILVGPMRTGGQP